MFRITGFLDSVHRPVFCKIQKNTTFRKLDLFPCSGEDWGTPAMLGALERSNLNHCIYGYMVSNRRVCE
jgi:hypothetical protein